MITFFVEGQTDGLFIKALFPDIEKDVVEYSRKPNDKINKYIQTIDKMYGKYFFLFDTDTKEPEEKLEKLLNQIKSLKKENCFPVIVQIESWYRAGCSENLCKKYKIKYISDTEKYDKRKMRQDFNTDQLINIFQEILNEFSFDSAQQLNASFKNFYLNVSNIL